MINTIICWGKSKIGKCHLFSLDIEDEEDIKIAKILKRNISLLQHDLDTCISKNSIDNVIEFNGEYINKKYLKRIKFEEGNSEEANIVPCLKECACGSPCETTNVDLKKLKEEVNKGIKRYNSDLAILRKVQNYCKALAYKTHNNDSVFFKFGRDRNNDLIALYFNLDSFVTNDRYYAVEPIFVFSGEGEYPFHQHTVLHLKRKEEESYVNIWGFQSNNNKKGHGTFLVKNLDEIIKIVNEKIILFNDQKIERTYNRGPIEIITGEVVPGNIPYNKLVSFYNKNGLPTITRMSDGYGTRIEIYKTVN